MKRPQALLYQSVRSVVATNHMRGLNDVCWLHFHFLWKPAALLLEKLHGARTNLVISHAMCFVIHQEERLPDCCHRINLKPRCVAGWGKTCWLTGCEGGILQALWGKQMG